MVHRTYAEIEVEYIDPEMLKLMRPTLIGGGLPETW